MLLMLILMPILYIANLPDQYMLSAAQNMEACYYTKGQTIIEQGTIGDAFFVVEGGLVLVTVS